MCSSSIGRATPDKGALFSLGRALVLAGARLLEIDSREIGLELKPRSAEEFTILLHDTVPGGAGHCFELFRLGRPWLEEARRILWVTSSAQQRLRKSLPGVSS